MAIGRNTESATMPDNAVKCTFYRYEISAPYDMIFILSWDISDVASGFLSAGVPPIPRGLVTLPTSERSCSNMSAVSGATWSKGSYTSQS